MKKNILLFAALTSALLFSSCIGVSAAESQSPATGEEAAVYTRSEVTEYHYMYIGDVLYKRLWSVTYNRWIDPYWTIA